MYPYIFCKIYCTTNFHIIGFRKLEVKSVFVHHVVGEKQCFGYFYKELSILANILNTNYFFHVWNRLKS